MNPTPGVLARLCLIAFLATPFLTACQDAPQDSPASVGLDTVPPAIPRDLHVAVLDDGQVRVSWAANRTDPDLAGYVVYRSDHIEGGYRVRGTHPIRSNSWLDADPGSRSALHYRVAARDAADNESPMSAPVTARFLPRTPTAAAVLSAPAR